MSNSWSSTARTSLRTATALIAGSLLVLAWMSTAEAHGKAAPSVKTRVVTEFETTLQPDELHGFIVGEVAANRGYVVEVTPSSDSDDGAFVLSRVEPEFDGSVWNDVLRVQLQASTVPVDAHIRVYGLIAKH